MMALECSKRIGEILLISLFLIGHSTNAFSEQVETELRPGRISIGETSSLQIRIENVEEAEPVSVPAVKGLMISFNGSQRFSSTQIVNWKKYSSKGVILSFSIVAERRGRFIIPPIVIESGKKRLRSKAVSLIVSGAIDEYRGEALFYPEISVSKRSVYIGEPVIVRYFLLHRGLQIRERPLFEKLPETRGFLRESYDERIEDRTQKRNGIDLLRTHIATFVLIPTERGSFPIGGGSVLLTVEQPDRFFSLKFSRRRRITFDAERVRVVPLPERGKPEGFQGNVGSFDIELEYDKKPMKIYEEKDIRLCIRGRGNLIALSKPLLERALSDVKIISEEGKGSLRIERSTLMGEKEFVYTIIPEREGELNIGRFVFNYFNFESSRYETCTTGDIRLNVTGDPSRKSEISLDEDEEAAGKVDFNIYLIALIVLAVAGIVISVILWERKKISLAVKGNSSGEEDVPQREEREISDRKILLSIKRGDSVSFLREYGDTVTLLEKRIGKGEGGDRTVMDAKIKEIKEALYRYKYGGEMITEGDMEALYREMKGLVDSVRR
jgi:hypothetical protein